MDIVISLSFTERYQRSQYRIEAEYEGYPRGCLQKKKKKNVPGQFAVVKYRSETYCWSKKLNREDYGLDKYWVFFFF
jgi:hypothetical protein